MIVHVFIAAIMVVSDATLRSGLGQHRTLFKKHSLTFGAPAPASPAAAPEAAEMEAPAGAPGLCECAFHNMCTCESALAHMECISRTCASPDCDCPDVQFSQSCGQIASVCKPTLDISCTPEQAICDGKFYQLSSSLVGLSIDLEKLDQDAHCGPSGRCTGTIDVHVAIHNSENGQHLECFLEDAPESKSKHRCSSEVNGDFANCTLPMPKGLPAGDKLEGWCRILGRTDDGSETAKSSYARITHDAPFYIYNHHKKIETKKFAEVPAPARKRYAVNPELMKPKTSKPADSGSFRVQGTSALLIAATIALRF